MAKIICMTKSLTGMVNASLEAATRLQDAGHQVIYACPWDIEEKVRGYGLVYHQLSPINFDPVPAENVQGIVAKLKRFASSLTNRKARQKAGISALGMEPFTAFLRDVKPDLLLIDLELHDYILTAVGHGYPTILLSSWFSIWQRPNLPPITSTMMPDRRMAIATAWWRIKAKRLRVILRSRLRTGFTDRESILRAYAKHLGIPARELTELIAFPQMTYRTLPVISMTVPQLEFPHSHRPNLHYVGPMVFRKRLTAEVDGRLSQLFAEKLDNERLKLIYCSVGTMHDDDAQFIERVITAVTDRPDWRLIVAAGNLADSATFHDVPDNVYLFRRVPQLNVLQHADCSINHGGNHTVNECVEFGVPMLICSGKRFDQNGCTARMAYHGLAMTADKDRDTAQTIQQCIDTLLSDVIYLNRVCAIRKQIHQNRDRFVAVVNQMLSELNASNRYESKT